MGLQGIQLMVSGHPSVWSNALVKTFAYRKPDLPPSMDGSALYQGGVYEWLQSQFQPDFSRLQMYRDYEAMDQYPDTSAFLDLVAEDAIQIDPQHQSSAWIDAKEKTILKEGERVLASLNIDSRLPSLCRTLAKFGDVFDMLFVRDGVYGAKYFPARDVMKNVDFMGNTKGYKIINSGDVSSVPMPKIDKELHPWEFTHYILPSRTPDSIYGDSLFLPIRDNWKRVKMLEDNVFIYEILRAHDRFLYKIDTGNATPEERLRIIKRWRSAYKKRNYIDPVTGEFKSNWLASIYDDDIWWPVMSGSTSDVVKLPGTVGGRDLGGIDYFKSRMYAGLKVPRVYLSQESDLPAAFVTRLSLAQQDIRYARTILKVQKAVIIGLRRTIDVHMAARGFIPKHLIYQLMMTVVSQLAETQRLETLQIKVGVAERLFNVGTQLMLNPATWTLYILSNILGMEDEMIKRVFPDPKAVLGAPSNIAKNMPMEDLQKANQIVADVLDEDPDFVQRLGHLKDLTELDAACRGRISGGKYVRRDILPAPGSVNSFD